MAKGETRTKAVSGRLLGRTGRRRANATRALSLWSLASIAVLAFGGRAAAQVPGIAAGQVIVPLNSNVQAVTGASNVVTGATIVSTAPTIDGQGGPGYFVANGGSLTINNSTLQHFTTTGGSGSGGGLGAGGAIYVDTGGSVTLNGVNFSHNNVVGGLGGTSSYYGGSLNNIASAPGPNATDPTGPPNNGTNGGNGKVHFDDQYRFGDGNGNGTNSDNFQAGANNGGSATNGFGGNGGNGGPGTNGWATNPVAEQNVQIANTTVLTDSIGTGLDAATEAVEVVALAGEIAAGADPFETPIAVIEAAKTAAEIIINAAGIANDVIGLENDIQNQVLAQATLDSWKALYANGEAGNGGNGGAGAAGGAGSYGFGGGAGGTGGVYGLSANPNGIDGTGGNGGLGGGGGFGGGGGAGGYAFGSTSTLCGVAGCTSSDGTPGSGGAAGFGGGVGSVGGVINETAQCTVAIPGIACGGAGGDGFGGAIFVNDDAELNITGSSTFFGNSAQGGSSLNGGAPGSAAGSDLFIMHGAHVNLAPGVDSNGVPNVVTFFGTIADDSKATLGPLGLSSYAFDVNNPAASYGTPITVFSGETKFYGANTYSGDTVINGGAFISATDNDLNDTALLNTATNTTGAPDYSKTDGMLQADDGIGLPTSSNLNFSGPSQFTGGVLQLYCGENPPCTSLSFTRSLNPNPTFTNPGGVQWTGSGGFAAIDAPLTVTLNNNAKLTWGVGNSGFIQQGYSLIFGSANSNAMVTFTNPIDISGGTIGAGTAASILVGYNGNLLGSTAEMSGVISGAGDLSINGGGFNGILKLGAAETYTGATSINSGALVLDTGGSISSSSSVVDNGILDISPTHGASITTLSGSGGVFLGSQTLTVTNASSTFSGIIADGGIAGGTGGNLTIAGGTEILSGVNTYTGLTTINPGATLTLTGIGSIADSSEVLDNGTFDITQTAIGAMITTLAGSGTADIGSKVLVITKASTPFNGALNGDGTGGVVVSGGTLTLNGTINNIGSIVLDSGTALHASSTANAGLFNAATNTSTPIVVMPAGGSPIDVFTGSVHVIGALDIENITTPELIILPGDILVGVGGVNVPTVIQSTGTNSPGDAPGSIVYSASLTHMANSNDVVQIDGPVSSFPSCTNPPNSLGCAGTFSTEIVTGATSTYTAGGTLVPTMTGWGSPGPAPSNYIPPLGASFVIVESQGGVLGSFSSLTEPALGVKNVSGGLAAGTRLDALYWSSPTVPYANPASWPFTPTATTGAITLYVTPSDYTNLTPFGVNLNPNQTQVGGAINALRGPPGVRTNDPSTSDLGALFGQDPSQLPRDFDTLSGEVGADAQHVGFLMLDEFLEMMMDPAVSGRSGTVGEAALGFVSDDQDILPSGVTAAYGSVMPAPAPAPAAPGEVTGQSFQQRWNVWGAAFGGANSTKGDPDTLGNHNMTANIYGAAAGVDYHLTPDTVVGFALSGGGTSWAVVDALGSGRSDAFQIGLYSKTHIGSAYVADSFAFGNHWMTTDRYAFTGEHIGSNFDAQSFGARLEGGYRFARGWLAATPYAAFQARGFHTPSYGETDLSAGFMGLFALDYSAATALDLNSELGARFESVRPLRDGMQVVLRTRLAWEHDWVNNPAMTATFASTLLSGAAPGSPLAFIVNGAGIPHDSGIVSAGADLHVSSGMSIGAKFDGNLSTMSQTYGGTATLRYTW